MALSKQILLPSDTTRAFSFLTHCNVRPLSTPPPPLLPTPFPNPTPPTRTFLSCHEILLSIVSISLRAHIHHSLEPRAPNVLFGARYTGGREFSQPCLSLVRIMQNINYLLRATVWFCHVFCPGSSSLASLGTSVCFCRGMGEG